MKFNKSLDWLKESEEDTDDVFSTDELDQVEGDEEEQINEVRYINPNNLDKYDPSEIEEVTTASGEKRYKRKSVKTAGNVITNNKEPKEPKKEPIKSIDDKNIDKTIVDTAKDMPADFLAELAKAIDREGKDEVERQLKEYSFTTIGKYRLDRGDKDIDKVLALTKSKDADDLRNASKYIQAERAKEIYNKEFSDKAKQVSTQISDNYANAFDKTYNRSIAGQLARKPDMVVDKNGYVHIYLGHNYDKTDGNKAEQFVKKLGLDRDKVSISGGTGAFAQPTSLHVDDDGNLIKKGE